MPSRNPEDSVVVRLRGSGKVELYRLDAEANADSAGNWQTFKK